MKKLNVMLLSVVALGMSVVSCSKDDKKDTAASMSVPTGTWVISTVSETKGTAVSPEKSWVDPSCTGIKAYYVFNADKSLKDGFVNVSDTNNPCAFQEYAGTYSQAGNVLSLNEPSDNYTVDYTLVSVASTKMVVKWAFDAQDATHFLTLTLNKQ